jgi:hypothetical protein
MVKMPATLISPASSSSSSTFARPQTSNNDDVPCADSKVRQRQRVKPSPGDGPQSSHDGGVAELAENKSRGATTTSTRSNKDLLSKKTDRQNQVLPKQHTTGDQSIDSVLSRLMQDSDTGPKRPVERELSDSSSRRGRRIAFNSDSSSSSQRSERRNIANKLRSKNLLGNSFHGSSHHGNNAMTAYGNNSNSSLSANDTGDDASCASFGSSVSSKSEATQTIKKKPKDTIGIPKNFNGKEVKAIQLSASISSALSCDDDASCDESCYESCYESFSNIRWDVLDLSSSLLINSDFDNSFVEKGENTSKKKHTNKDAGVDSSNKKQIMEGKSELKEKSSKRIINKRDDEKGKKKDRSSEQRKCATIKKLKSCVKGNNKRRLVRAKDNSRGVHFYEAGLSSSSCHSNKVHLIKCLLKYSKDLWWSKEEIEQLRLLQSDFSSASEEEISNVQSYMQAYRQGRQQMNYEQHISESTYQELVIGIKRGYGGIEAHSNLHDTICQHIKDTIRSILRAYENAVEKEKASNMAALYSKPSTTNCKPLLNASVMVKAHSEALTETDRQWATAMGTAQQQAAK